jgi:serine/threonine protein kinase
MDNGPIIYTVVHKLGHGGFPTVWLVKRQRKQSESTNTVATTSFHALKILCSNLGDMEEDHEVTILQHLGQVSRCGHPNIVDLEDTFTVSGPNGKHRCLVFPFLGPSLRSSKTKTHLTPSTRHRVCQQLASAVEFLHSRGVCHGGKIPTLSPLSPQMTQILTSF